MGMLASFLHTTIVVTANQEPGSDSSAVRDGSGQGLPGTRWPLHVRSLECSSQVAVTLLLLCFQEDQDSSPVSCHLAMLTSL